MCVSGDTGGAGERQGVGAMNRYCVLYLYHGARGEVPVGGCWCGSGGSTVLVGLAVLVVLVVLVMCNRM